MNTYFDENGVEKLICPICNCRGYSRLSSHLFNSHPDLSKDQVLKLYPDTKFVSSGLHQKQSDATKKQWENPEYAQLMSKIGYQVMKELWNDPEFRKMKKELNSQFMKALWDDPEYRERKRIEAGNTLRKLWEDSEFRKRRIEYSSSILVSLWSNQEWKEWKSQQQSEAVIERLTANHNKIEYVDRNNNILKLRSHFEERLATFLDLIEVNYEYESKYFWYNYESYNHKYFPDFYIAEFNLIIEVKPSCYINDKIVQLKKQSVLNEGYNFIFITENELEDLFKSELFKILSGATTIER